MMESENICYNTEHKNDSNSINLRDISTDRNADDNQKHCMSFIQNQAVIYSRSRWFVMITVFLGLSCVLLLVAIIAQHNKLSTERDLMKMSYMNIEYSEALSSLKMNYSQLTDEREELQNRFNFVREEKLELETNNKLLTGEKEELQKNISSMREEQLELDAQLKKWNLQRGSSWYYISSEQKSWSDSRQFCRDRGSDLVIINTEEEQRFISSIIKERVWIGLSYAQHTEMGG
nr:C-type lectin domain family 10 member A-like [Misgurnus anguillicaudatus]